MAQTKTTILVVEDEASLAEMLSFILEEAGYAVLRAINGREGLQKLAEQVKSSGGKGGVDLILSDVMMPRMNGLEMCRQIQADTHFRDIPIILISAKSAGYAREGGEDSSSGCQYAAFIEKPFNLDILLRTIKQVLNKHV
jgi:two-component system alkaline phosphatase synthesis response regulator PhoP